MIGIEGRTNEEGVTSGTQKKKERCNDRVEEVDEIEVVGNRKRKLQDSVSPLSRLIRSCHGRNH